MGQLSQVQEFIDQSTRARTKQSLSLLMEQITKEMGFDYYALVHHVDIRAKEKDTALWLENYPRQWAEVFVNSGLYSEDPMLIAAQATNVGFAWSDVPSMIKLTRKHKDILVRVRKEGLGDGFTVPAHVPGESNGSCNFAMAGSALIPRENIPMAQLVGGYAFQAARKLVLHRLSDAERVKPKLTTRQLECVVLIARGKSDKEIAAQLGLRPSTISEYIEDACERYGVSRRIQLAFHAVHDGHLTLADAVGSEIPPLSQG